MKPTSFMNVLLLAIVFLIDIETIDAKRTSYSGGSTYKPSYSGGTTYKPSSSYSGGYSGGSTYTKTYTKRTVVSGTYRPYGTYVLVIGTPYYDVHYSYYYDGHTTYRPSSGGSASGIVAMVIVIAVIFCICICIGVARRTHGGEMHHYGGDHQVVVHEEIREEIIHHEAPKLTTVLGQQHPTATCNSGHRFCTQNHNPYPGDTATCDNCQQIINWGYGGFHCPTCEVDLCQGCGQQRANASRSSFQPPMQSAYAPPMQQAYAPPPPYPPGQAPPVYGAMPMQAPPAYPPGGMPMQQMAYPPGQMPGMAPPAYPPGYQQQPSAYPPGTYQY